MSLFRTAKVVVIAAFAAVSSLQAQSSSGPRWNVDVTFGLVRPLRGEYFYAASPTVDLLIGSMWRANPKLPLLAAISGSLNSDLPHGDVCRFPSNGSIGCLQDIPSVRALTALFGADLAPLVGGEDWSFRVLGGPGIYRVSSDDYRRAPLTVGGLQSRVDASVGKRNALVLSLRASAVPGFLDDGGGMAALSVGFRLAR